MKYKKVSLEWFLDNKGFKDIETGMLAFDPPLIGELILLFTNMGLYVKTHKSKMNPDTLIITFDQRNFRQR